MNLNKQLARFWELEELPEAKALSKEERDSESYFRQTTTRDSEDRFIVRLPLKVEASHLDDPKQTAERRLSNLERSWLKRQERTCCVPQEI